MAYIEKIDRERVCVRQTDRQTYRQTDRKTDRHRERHVKTLSVHQPFYASQKRKPGARGMI